MASPVNEMRLPPMNTEAEEAVLGSILVDPGTIEDVLAIIKPQDFYREKNQWVYEACLSCQGRINQITVAQELMQRGRLEAIGGGGFLSLLVERLPTSVHAEHYAQIVSRLAYCRRLIGAAGQIAAIGYEAPTDIEQAHARVIDAIERVRPTVTAQVLGPPQLAEAVTDAIAPIPDADLIRFGYPSLDRVLGGMAPGDMNVVAARPVVGKTQIALEVSWQNAKWKNLVLFWSFEMTVKQLLHRLIAMETGIDMAALRSGHLTDIQWKLVGDTAVAILDANLWVLPSRATPEGMFQVVKNLKQSHGLKLLVVDYLQLIARSLPRAYGDDVRLRVGFLTAFLKRIAIDLEVPVLLVSQISRKAEEREGHRPTLADQKESGTIEEDADLILLLHRPELYIANESKRMESDDYGMMEIKVAKHRQLGIDRVFRLRWQPERHRYGEETYDEMALGMPGFRG